ncbi:LysR family transcriptional regulator, partial [Escherichia coli]|nr:LysR family transcriptional regulator [Escherichia coli]
LPLTIEDTWGILVNTKHPLAKKTVVTPSDIETNPIVVSNQSFIDNQLASWLGGHFEQLNVIGRYNLLYNASLLAKENIASILC